MEQSIAVSVDRWSLNGGALVSLQWPTEQSIAVSVGHQVVLKQRCFFSITGVIFAWVSLQWSL